MVKFKAMENGTGQRTVNKGRKSLAFLHETVELAELVDATFLETYVSLVINDFTISGSDLLYFFTQRLHVFRPTDKVKYGMGCRHRASVNCSKGHFGHRLLVWQG